MVGSIRSKKSPPPPSTSKSKTSIVKSMPDIPTMPSPRPHYKAQSSRGIYDSNSAEIEERVRVAVKKFEVLQGNIQLLVEALKSQHLSIKTLDEDRLKTAKQLEVLVSDSPLAPVVASSKTNLEERASATASDGDDDEDSLTMTTYKTMVSAVKKTYLELHKNQYDLVLAQAQSFDTSIVQYAEEWLEVISGRVSSNLMEFKKLCENLEHYSTKVDKLKSHEKPNSAMPSPKLARNETKLRGARESHDNMGENLYKLMEEVTVRAWKDLVPLLMKSIQLDLTQAAEERRIIWEDLEVVLLALEAIAAQHNVSPDGRLARLKKDHIDILYTGTHSSHRTATKPSGPSSTPKPATIQTVTPANSVEVSFEENKIDQDASGCSTPKPSIIHTLTPANRGEVSFEDKNDQDASTASASTGVDTEKSFASGDVVCCYKIPSVLSCCSRANDCFLSFPRSEPGAGKR